MIASVWDKRNLRPEKTAHGSQGSKLIDSLGARDFVGCSDFGIP